MGQPQLNWVGQTIAGRYKLEAVLGQGGMSTVYKTTDANLQRPVALKLIHAHLSNDPEFVRRFEQEAAAVARLRHPNIIQIYDFAHEGDLSYMVMEYVPGETLQDKLKALNATNQRLPLAETIQLMAIICDTVAYAHNRGMIHRDLKPANVMLTPQGLPVLMDFGVAKMLGEGHLTATGTIVGTARYMSPEQASGEHPDKRTDIYSLGVILYEMTTGRPPFDGDSDIAILMKHVSQPVPDIRQIQSSVPDLLVAVIEKALAKNPAERYQTAADMAIALRAISLQPRHTGSLPVVAPSFPPSPAPLVQPARKSGLPIWLVGAGIALLVLGLSLVLFFVGYRFLRPSTGEQTPVAATEEVAAPTEEQVTSPTEEPATTSSTEETSISTEAAVLPSSKDMVKVDTGLYTVGRDTPGQNYAPVQQVELTEFWIDQYEVTNARYAEFLAATGEPPPAKWAEGAIPAGQEQHPVKGVTWNQAAAYCEWANKRLPNEAEWEIAARGSEGRLYPWGDDQSEAKLPQSGTYEVGSIAANLSPIGAFDMAGNVWEWVGETYAPVADGHRVLRGGENGFLKDMAYRLSGPPDQESIIKTAGIRCAADQVEVVPVTNVLYEDGFVDTSGNWPVEDVEGSPYRIGYHPPDYYHVEVRAPEDSIAVSPTGDFTDVTIETNVLVDHTDTAEGDFRYGLVARRSAEDQYYAFTVSPRSGSWQVLKRMPAGSEVLAEGSTDTLRGFAPPGFTPDKTDKLRVDERGSDFVFLINDEVVAEVSDTEYTSGEVGFYVETLDETLAHLHFDSLTVREVEAEPEPVTNVLYEDGFVDASGNWPEEDVEGSPYRIGYHPPDYYHVEVRAPEDNITVSPEGSYEDATVETTVLVDHTDTAEGDFRYGLVVRRTGEDQYYAFTVSSRTGSWQALKRTPAGSEVLAEGSTDTLRGFAPPGFTPDKTDKLRVDMRGSDFVFLINDEVVAEVSDTEYASGEVGFYVETLDETLAHLHYDSLTVREVEAEPEPVIATLYEDGFVDASGNWPEEDVEGSPYRIGYHPPDYYHVEVRAPEDSIAVSPQGSYEDVAVETAVLADHTDTAEGDFRYGLVVRRSGEDQYYAFTVSSRTGSWQALKRTPAGLEVLAEGSTNTLRGFAPPGFTPDKTDKLRVDMRGSDFIFQVNDEVVTRVSDPEYASGEVGFYVETLDETLAHLHYDSLIVREVEAETFDLVATPAPPTPVPAPEGMVLIPAGYFQMGSSTGEANETPEHPVFLDAFYLDLYEVTNVQYRECVKERGCTQAGSPNTLTYQGYRDDPAYDNHPVVSVTWDQADAYCKWAGKHLPTEAQWEYAASGPENLTWPWGNTFEADLSAAGEADTQPVGSYSDGVSPFGVFDMAGNAAEWVADDYDETFYDNSPPSNPFSANVSAGRVYRGGSYGAASALYTTSRRQGNVRTYSEVRVGFRCALDAPELTPPEERAAMVAEFCEAYAVYKPEALCP